MQGLVAGWACCRVGHTQAWQGKTETETEGKNKSGRRIAQLDMEQADNTDRQHGQAGGMGRLAAAGKEGSRKVKPCWLNVVQGPAPVCPSTHPKQ